jgi:homoserine dehydrogenase
MMQEPRLALIGFGNVGQGFTRILRDRGDDIAQRFGVRFRIVAVCDLLKGSVYNSAGLSPGDLLASIEAHGDLSGVTASETSWDALATIERSDADALVEISYTDLETGEPALTHIKAALGRGMHVVTTNKGPVALFYPALRKLAAENDVRIGLEGTVLSGTPALRLGLDVLNAASIRSVEGIFNGTTNYILTRMEQGATYAEALAEAQDKGYAEADPTGDVEGHDAAGKVVILSNVLMDAPITIADVEREGITGLTPEDIEAARAEGKRWKLIGRVARTAQGVSASVKPVMLPVEHPLASVSGATNAILYETEVLGSVTLSGPGAGREETGYALLSDLLAIYT